MNETVNGFAALVAMVFFAVLLCIKLGPLWHRPLRGATAFCRRSMAEAFLLAAFLLCLVHRGATKGTNGVNRVCAGGFGVEALQADAPLRGGGEGALRFTSFTVSSNAVTFEAEWPASMYLPEGKLDLFATHDVDTNVWELVGNYDVPSSETNLVDAIQLSTFPFPSCDRLFIVLGTRADLDGDGLIDARERLVLGTSPLFADTDGDGLLDGEEQSQVPPIDPLNPDSDGDGYLDGEETLAGMSPLSHNGGAETTIRYYYDQDGRMSAACSGANQTSSASALSPAGNPIRQTAR